jgi:hypothetical protein
VNALRKTYAGKVPESADLVVYWWYKAAELLAAGQLERFGFITTNSITQTFNRRVVQGFLSNAARPVALSFAIPDHPWVDAADGAAVRVAFTVAERGTTAGNLFRVTQETTADDDAHEVTLVEQTGVINSDLTVGADVAGAVVLKANSGLSSNGMMLAGSGFIITPEKAAQLGLGTIVGLEQYIRPYRNGKDLTDKPREVFLIDLFGLAADEVLARFPKVFQHLLETVKPERDKNNRKRLKDIWWQFGEVRKTLRGALQGTTRYIATPETAKHRMFQFLSTEVAPDHMLVAIATEDAFHHGVLSSRIHVIWADTAGGRMGMGNDSRYNSSRCFTPFPFPTPTEAQQTEIRKLAEQLDVHRKRQQVQHPTLTLTDLYNVVGKLRAGLPLTAKEQVTHENGLAAVVLELHKQLDAAVAAAYGWAPDLPDAELLTRLVQLNQQRAAEEAAGTVRYLRPAYQAPAGASSEQLSMSSGLATEAATDGVVAVARREWPAGLAQQMRAVREVVEGSSGGALTAASVAGFFAGKVRAGQVQPLLESLAELALVRVDAEAQAYSA